MQTSMFYVIVNVILFISLQAKYGIAKCPNYVTTSLGYVVEHAVWRGWHQVVIFTNNNDPDCKWAMVRLVKCLGINGIAGTLDVKVSLQSNSFLGLVVLPTSVLGNGSDQYVNILRKLTIWNMNVPSFDWLILAKSITDFKAISGKMNETAIRFDQTIVVAFPDINSKSNRENIMLCDQNFTYKKDKIVKNKASKRVNNNNNPYIMCQEKDSLIFNCNKTIYEINYYKASNRFTNLTRNRLYKRFGNSVMLKQAGTLNYNFTGSFGVTNISHFSFYAAIRKWKKLYNVTKSTDVIYVVQYFKVRINSTLYVAFLGGWSQERSMSLVESPQPVEGRNFMGELLMVGKSNSTALDGSAMIDRVDDDVSSTAGLMDDVLQFLALRLNATPLLKYYGKLGFRSYEGVWTGLLGALMDRTVDLALEPVTVSSQNPDIDFIFPITETMSNIYIRHQETSAVRDIFLAPFSPRLIASVVAVALVAAVTIVLVSRTSRCRGSRHMSCVEALLWSIGILCQQGGSWTPSSPAASVVLLVVLLFAVVTYNSYAAFITSVLSVRVASVSSVADVLLSPHLKIGYVKNGADQMYLMSTKDAQLNAFYIRGYSEAENLVSSAEEGLVRAAVEDYAFFTGQRIARTTLRSLSQARGRCALRELPVLSTRAQLSFPLPRRSPYARPILVSLLHLRNGGVLARLDAALVPSMPQCAPPSGFASARAADVKTALCVILAGLLIAIVIGLGEYIWKNRKEHRSILKKRLQNLSTKLSRRENI